ncbi:Crp/Fnr family transcriptional regulator [Asticcacaulis sp. 201]|uniref:Crp/Fnr family transcriptional regulator n=1 Tax=Asticcacaulis sp. 201 TaxID=3028787 RepID=UPI00291648B8|nr:Crp/Fnr family transcriptional regulator [Asticcacaulis sp. 201]MDV6331821.1 Crp/Fnr family transcriptional regulator [Asticcacaulis sp. 201]
MTTATPDQLRQNALLSILHDEDRFHLEPHIVAVYKTAGDVLLEAGDDVIDTWFPCGGALAAFCLTTQDGVSVDVGFVGREGAIGGIVSNGHVPAYSTAVVRVPGLFLRIKTSALEQAKQESLALRHWFARYSDCLLAQVFQTAACNATHTIRQRLAKLILAGLARTGDMEYPMTQEQLASMLGVGRSFVSRVIGAMRQEGTIESRRGQIILKDLAALRHQSCGCDQLVDDHFDVVLHGIYPKI